MIEEEARIVAVDDDYAWVETQRKSTCNSCQVNKGCGTSLLSNVLGQKRTRLRVPNPASFREGDKVMLGLDEGALVKGSLLLYTLPLFSMFIFALFGYVLFFLYGLDYGEGYKILFSFIGLISGFWFVAKGSRRLTSNPRYQASILRKIGENASITFHSLRNEN